MRENDAPFSKPWEEYSSPDLIAKDLHINGFTTLDKAFEGMELQCPACKTSLTPKNLVR